MKVRNHISSILILTLFFLLQSCGGSTGSSSSDASSSSSSDTYSLTLLEYILESDTASTITDLAESSDTNPSVMYVSIIDNKHYVNLSEIVTIEGETCYLVEVSQDQSLRCIDAEDMDQYFFYPLATMPAQEAKQYQQVFPTSTGDVYYKTSRYRIAVLRTSGTREYITEEGWQFGKMTQDSSGNIYATECTKKDPDDSWATEYVYAYCAITDNKITDLTDDASGVDLYFLQNDQVFIANATSGDNDLSLTKGNLGDALNATNFSYDYEDLSEDDAEISSGLAEPFETDDEELWAHKDTGDECLQRLSPTISECISFTNIEEFYVIEYRSGSQILVSGCTKDYDNIDTDDDVLCGTYLYDIDTETLTEIELAESFKVHSARYISDNEILIAGRVLAEETYTVTEKDDGTGSTYDSYELDPLKYYYYKYEIDTTALTLLFESENNYYISIPF